MCHVCHHVRTLLLVRADVLGSVLNDNRIHDELHLHDVSIVCATRAIMREHVCVRVCARASVRHDQGIPDKIRLHDLPQILSSLSGK